MKKKATIIGPRAFVDIKGHNIKSVPAKVDTGADSSSIWATRISEDGGELSFVLFGPGSPWYTDEVIKTKEYSIRSIKNSFGSTEFRYKVPIKITLHGRTIRARFTLSNRASNRYPILIGRQTLKDKFIVDVSQPFQGIKPLHVLVLVHNGNEKIRSEFKSLTTENKDKLNIDIVRYKDLVMVADSQDVTLTIKTTNQDVASYDFIYFLTRVRDAELAAIVAAYAKRHGINFADRAGEMLGTDTKAHQAILLAGRSVAIPKTIYMSREYWAEAYEQVVDLVGLPFVFKDNNGLKGRNNFLIKSKKNFKAACKVTEEDQLQMVAQKFIPNNGYYRVLVMGRNVVLAMSRKVNTEKNHLYNRDDNGAPELVNLLALPSDVHRLAIGAAQMLLLEVAGVDILQDKESGIWYCLEVNNSPQLVGGAYVKEKMRALGDFFITESSK